MPSRRILYLQYTNPGAYPPLHHSAMLLADKSWDVRFLGIHHQEVVALTLPQHPNIHSFLWGNPKNKWLKKIHYVLFLLWADIHTLVYRPQWIYASDPLITPAALLLSFLGFKVTYHEHDSPGKERWIIEFCRRKLAERATLVVFPNQERLNAFSKETERRKVSFTVWNCPRVEEISPKLTDWPRKEMAVVYEGNFTEERLPLTVIEALPMLPISVTLEIIGYPAQGNISYLDRLKTRAKELGVFHRIRFSSPLPREKLLSHLRETQFGLALFPKQSQEINLKHMAGASNKVFDYMTQGTLPIVTDSPEWREFLKEKNFGLTVDPEKPESIAAAILWALSHPKEINEIRTRAWKKCREDWNYEKQWQPVMEELEKKAS